MPYRRTGRPPGRPRHPEPLTPAEQRVLEQVRAGLTNAEIAVRLGVSPETVKTHVSNMLTKLDLTDRAELAAWQPGVRRWWQRILAPLAWTRRAAGNIAHAGSRFVWAMIALATVAVAVALLLAIRAGPGAGTDETPIAVIDPGTAAPSPTGTPGVVACGTHWAHEGTGPDAAAALASGLAELPWTAHIPSAVPAGFTLSRVSIEGRACSPPAATVSVDYVAPDGRALRLHARKLPLAAKGQNWEISGFINVPGKYVWRYVVLRNPQPDGSTKRAVEIAYRGTDGVSTYLALDFGSSEDRTIDELRYVAGSIDDYGPPIADPTHPPYEEPPQADVWTPSPDGCSGEEPSEASEAYWRENGKKLTDRVTFVRLPFEIGWEPGRGMLVDTETGDYLLFDERGRRFGAVLCDPESIAILRGIAHGPGFREWVRSTLSRPP